MVAEQVIFDFRQSTSDSAQVSGWFLFHNTGEADEHLKVRFPLNGDTKGLVQDPVTGEQTEVTPLIEDFSVWNHGQRLKTQTIKDTDPNAEIFFLGYGSILYWSVFEVDFPAGKDVKLTINYTYRPTEEAYDAQLSYILATGAGWKGPIGTVDIIFRFPYELNEINSSGFDWYGGQYRGGIITREENQFRLHWNDLEPTNDDNITLYLLQPHLWQEILRRRLQVIAAPDDAVSWEALAKAYAAAAVEKHGFFYNPAVIDLYFQASERALTLDSKNVSFHMEFANNLFNSSDYNYGDNQGYYHALVRNELAIVMQLDPSNAEAAELYQKLEDTEKQLMTTPVPFPTKFIPTYTPYGNAEPTSTPTPSPANTITLTRTILPLHDRHTCANCCCHSISGTTGKEYLLADHLRRHPVGRWGFYRRLVGKIEKELRIYENLNQSA